jgi:hypothetical protein
MRRYAQKLELFSMWVMVFGVVALCQPWVLILHSYGATIILAGLILFNIFSRFKPPKAKPSPSAEQWPPTKKQTEHS